MSDSCKVGKKGELVIPSKLRKRFRLTQGSYVIADATDDGILLRPASLVEIEVYSPERKAELLLNNAVGRRDYARARADVRKLGLDPDGVKHRRPKGG